MVDCNLALSSLDNSSRKLLGTQTDSDFWLHCGRVCSRNNTKGKVLEESRDVNWNDRVGQSDSNAVALSYNQES
jgi:hypothetical protein